MKAESRNKKITFLSINKDLSLFKIRKDIIQKKTKNSVTAIPTIKDRGKIKSRIVRLLMFKCFIEQLFQIKEFESEYTINTLTFLPIFFIIINCFF